MNVKLIMRKFIVSMLLIASPISVVLATENNNSPAVPDIGAINGIPPSASAESEILFPYGQSFIDSYKLSFEDEEVTETTYSGSNNGKTTVKVETISPTPTLRPYTRTTKNILSS